MYLILCRIQHITGWDSFRFIVYKCCCKT